MNSAQQQLGARMRELRAVAGLTLKDLRSELNKVGVSKGTSEQHLSQIERGNTWADHVLVAAVDSVLHAGGELVRLLRDAKVPPIHTAVGDGLAVTAHLFFPLFLNEVPPPMEPHVSGELDFVPRLGWTAVHGGLGTLHCFPFGVVVLHEAHDLQGLTLSAIAAWRVEQLARCGTAVVDHLRRLEILAEPVDHAPYCFTVFVVREVPWREEHLWARLVHMLAMPRAMLSPDGTYDQEHRAETLLHSHVPIGDVVDFSLTGSHIGAASWAAVSLLPDDGETLVAAALIELEIQLQALWCYASNAAERGLCGTPGHEPRLLRQALSRLQRPWPTERTGVTRLREALVQTSRVVDVVRSALDSAEA